MAKQAIIVALLVLFLVASDIKLVASDCIGDCYNRCPRVHDTPTLQCEHNCQIKCGGGGEEAFKFPDNNGV